MVRGFGLLLVAGVVVAFAYALTAGLATLSMVRATATGSSEGAPAAGDPSSGGMRPAGSGWGADAVSSSHRWIRDFVAGAGERLARWGRSALAASISAPGKVLAAALVLAVAGWIAGTRTELVSDIRQLLPSDLPELEDVDELEQVTGVSGDLYVTVEADDLTDPEVIAWMAEYERRVLERNGYEAGVSTCQDDDVEVCPGTTLATLFAGQEIPSRAQVRELLDLLPEYFSQAVVDRDESGDGGTALIGFGIRVMPFDEQKELIDDIRAQLDPPGTDLDPPAEIGRAHV